MSFDSLQPRIHLADLVFRDYSFDLFLCRLLCVVHCLFRLLSHENNVRAMRARCESTILDDEIMRIWILHEISLTLYCHSWLDLLVILTILAESISTFLFRSIMTSLTMLSHALHTPTYIMTLIGRDLTTQVIIIHEQLGYDLVHGMRYIEVVAAWNNVGS